MLTALFMLVVVLAGAAGGALTGTVIGGKDLGAQVAGMMGAFYGLTATIPAAVLFAIYLVVSK